MKIYEIIDQNRTEYDDLSLKKRYDHFNHLLFGGALPEIPVVYARLKSVGGVVNAKVRSAGDNRWAKKTLVPGSLTMKISSLYQRGSQAIDAILIHEMIHVKFISEDEFTENHGSKFTRLAQELGRKVGFVIPLTDDVTGLELSSSPTKSVGIIVLCKKAGGTSVAVVSEKYARDNLDALKNRWGRPNSSLEKIEIILGTGRIEARYPVQRKKIPDLMFYILKEPELLDDLQNKQMLATIVPSTTYVS